MILKKGYFLDTNNATIANATPGVEKDNQSLRRSSRTALKRRLRWDEDRPNLGAYEGPEPITGPSHLQDLGDLGDGASQAKSGKVAKVPKAEEPKAEGSEDEGRISLGCYEQNGL